VVYVKYIPEMIVLIKASLVNNCIPGCILMSTHV